MFSCSLPRSALVVARYALWGRPFLLSHADVIACLIGRGYTPAGTPAFGRLVHRKSGAVSVLMLPQKAHN